MKNIAFGTLLASCLLIAPLTQANAADAEAGKAKSATCGGCHGMEGEGKEMPAGVPSYPRLSGQLAGYLSDTMHAYKSDKRADAMMGAISKGLSDDDIADLAAYYSSL